MMAALSYRNLHECQVTETSLLWPEEAVGGDPSFPAYFLPMKVVAENRRARFDFEIIETLEAGIMLTGPEVKSCRAGHVNLAGAYVSFHNGEAVLKNASISPYSFAARMPHEERRDRKMLLKVAELKKITARTEEKGFTVVPLALHVGRFVKVLLGIGRGRKKTDKRQRIKEREVARKLKQTGDY